MKSAFVTRRCPALLLAALLGAAGCRQPPARLLVELGGEKIGSTWAVKIVDGTGTLAPRDAREIEVAARGVLERLERLLSTWDPASELSQFNRSSSLAPFAVAPETGDVFRRAISLADETGGAFDVTVGPLVEAWGFGAGPAPAGLPDPSLVSRLRAATGVRHLRVDPAGRWVQKLKASVRCDLSGLVPGYAADRLAALLEERGVREFLVDVGGEMVARGRNAAGQPWQVGIERPDGTGRALSRIIPLSDAAMATSGDYRNYREAGGERMAHIIDPRTGHPIRHRLASATVVDREAVRADALATALMVLGPDAGMALAERLRVAALLLVRGDSGTFEERRSTRMNVLLGGR